MKLSTACVHVSCLFHDCSSGTAFVAGLDLLIQVVCEFTSSCCLGYSLCCSCCQHVKHCGSQQQHKCLIWLHCKVPYILLSRMCVLCSKLCGLSTGKLQYGTQRSSSVCVTCGGTRSCQGTLIGQGLPSSLENQPWPLWREIWQHHRLAAGQTFPWQYSTAA